MNISSHSQIKATSGLRELLLGTSFGKGAVIQAVLARLLGVLGLLAGALLVAGTFFFAYGIIWFGYNFGISAISEILFSKSLRISHRCILYICGFFIVALFVENHRANKAGSPSCLKHYFFSPVLIWSTGVVGSLLCLLVNAGASSRVISDLLLVGPWLVTRSLKALWGYCSFTHEPTLRESANRLCEEQHQPQPTRMDGPSAVTQEERACFQLLGISPTDSIQTIKAAYRRAMKNWHPDRRARQSASLRRLAEERTKAINAAYRLLLGTRNSPLPGDEPSEEANLD